MIFGMFSIPAITLLGYIIISLSILVIYTLFQFNYYLKEFKIEENKFPQRSKFESIIFKGFFYGFLWPGILIWIIGLWIFHITRVSIFTLIWLWLKLVLKDKAPSYSLFMINE
jgi:hypothetical protein